MSDIITLLKGDHENVKTLLGRFDQIPPQGREEYFCEVVHTLVAHEIAEEMVVYPIVREASGGEQVADARIAEQSEAEELLSDMESEDPTSSAFTTKFEKLRKEVLAHAEREESTAFPLVGDVTSLEQRSELAERYTKAKETAPTHPHPHAPDTPPGNKVLGPVAAVFDRARDAVHRR